MCRNSLTCPTFISPNGTFSPRPQNKLIYQRFSAPLCPTFKSRLWDKFPFFRLLGVHIPRRPGTVSRFSLVCPTSLLQKVGQIREPAGYLLCPSPCWRLGPLAQPPTCLQGIASGASQSPTPKLPRQRSGPGAARRRQRASVQGQAAD